MNIPVIPVGEVQGLPAGAIQTVTAGTVASALNDEFAVTFGATLRQSQHQGDGLLQKSGAKDFESGKTAVASGAQANAGLATAGRETTGLQTIKGAGPVLSLQADSLKALNSNGAIEVQASGAAATASKDTVQKALADLEDSIAVLKAGYETPKVNGAGKVSQAKNVKEPGTKSAVSVVKPDGLAGSIKATAPSKTSSEIQVASLKNSLTLNGLLAQIVQPVIAEQGVGDLGIRAADTSLADQKGSLDVTSSNNLATATELKDGLLAAIKVSEKTVAIPVVLAEAATNAVSEKIAAPLGTATKVGTAKSSAKSGQETPLAGPLDAVKINAADTAQASLNGSTLATAAVSLVPAITDTLAAPASWITINSAGTKPVWKNNGPDPANPDAPTKVNMSAGTPTGVGRAGDSDRTAAVKIDTNFQAAVQAALPTTSNITTEAAAVTQAANASSLPASATSDLSSSATDKSVRNIPTTTNAKTFATPTTANGPQQSTVDLSLKNATPINNLEAVRSDVRSVKPTEQADIKAQPPSQAITEQPVGARVAADGIGSAKAAADNPVFQELPQRVKPVDASAKPHFAQSETSGGVSATAAAPVAAASGHTQDRSSAIAPVIAIDAVSTIAAAAGLQTTVQGTALFAPHVASVAAVPGVPESLTSVVSSLEAGRHPAAAAALPAEPYRTIAATPTALEIGVRDGTQGWLRIRAEVGDQGGVNASLAAGSNAGQEMLHRQLPALNAYLHSEQISATASVTDRVFAAANSSLAGMAAGSNGASPDTSGRSAHQDASGQNATTTSSGNQGGGTPGNGGQSDSFASLRALSSSDSTRSYDNRTGVTEAVVAQTPRDGESGRWLNVRA